MMGLADPWIALAYLLCILGSLLCIVYGLMKWNADGETIEEETAKWAQKEDEISESL